MPVLTITCVDWFRLIWDLVQRGVNVSEIERRTGISNSTLRGYLEGSQPPHWRGERLIALWCDVCTRRKDTVPMTEVILAPRVVHARTPQVRAQDDAQQMLQQALSPRARV